MTHIARPRWVPVRGAMLAVALAALLGVALVPAPPREDEGPTQRLLGPLTSVLASVHWLRFTNAVHGGDGDRAYAIARRALELDPDSADGWAYLAYHFVFTRASQVETGEPGARRRWILAGLDLLREGQGRPRAAAELAFTEGLYAATLADLEGDDAPWPGAGAELGPRALAAFEEAARLGHRGAREVLAGR